MTIATATAPSGRAGRLLAPVGLWWVRRSLRSRLTAASSLIILVGLVASAALLVLRQQSTLSGNLDTTVAQQADLVAAAAVRGQLPQPLPPSGDGAATVQVISAAGRVLTTSGNIDGGGRLFTFTGGRGAPILATASNVAVGDDRATYRVAALVTTTPNGPVTVYAALPTSDVTQSVTELTRALAVGLPVLIVLLAGVGYLVIGRALRPVELMRRQAAAIPGTDLHRRLESPSASDELGRLAHTLNDLLGRIEAGTSRQRQFVGDAAHELRSPLAALRTELEVAVRHPDTATAASIAPALLTDVVRLSRLVDDLLQLARLDANPHPYRQPVDLDDLMLDAADRARGRGPRIDSSGISAGRVTGDPQALRRVIANLVDNAIRHAASTVTLELHADPAAVTLVVADDGPGIPPADRERVFERFTRLDDARDRDAGGSGLGLAIVRDVVVAHGGQVRVADNHPGARFTVTLPADDA